MPQERTRPTARAAPDEGRLPDGQTAIPSELVSIIAHELRNPLASIRGLASLIRDRRSTISDADLIRFADAIVRQADRMTRLIADVQADSRIEQGDFSFVSVAYDPAALLKDVQSEAQSVWKGRMITLVIDDVPGLIDGDPDRIRHAIANLVEYACRYSDQGASVSVHASGVAGGIGMRITEDGGSIRSELIPHLFDRFARADTDREGSKGAGLSLYVAKRIVEAHGGRIWAESEPASGFSFQIILPLNVPPRP